MQTSPLIYASEKDILSLCLKKFSFNSLVANFYMQIILLYTSPIFFEKVITVICFRKYDLRNICQYRLYTIVDRKNCNIIRDGDTFINKPLTPWNKNGAVESHLRSLYKYPGVYIFLFQNNSVQRECFEFCQLRNAIRNSVCTCFCSSD